MATKAKPPATVVQNCNFTNSTAANEHTRAAVEALAGAAKANAEAIAAIAKTLAGSPSNMVGLRLGGND